MKLAFVGAGGFRTPGFCEQLLGSELSYDEVALFDPDEERLERIRRVVEGLERERGARLPLAWTSDRDRALEGADYVLCAIRPGGLRARALDERVPLAHGVIGQETTGPGGILFALRTLPALLDLAGSVAERAPAAWFLNFTNPAGMATEALQETLGQRVVGICDGPPALYRGVAAALALPEAELEFDYFGLNHLGWLRAVRHGGVDLLPALLADDDVLARTEEGRLFGAQWLRALGMLPNEYLVYYYRSREVLEQLQRRTEGRADLLLAQQRSFYRSQVTEPAAALAAWRAAHDERTRTYMDEVADARPPGTEAASDDGGYAGVALAVVRAIHLHERCVLTLNTANHGSMPFLDREAVVEVPCVVDGAGIAPLAVGDVPLHARGLVECVKAVERLTIAAVRESSDRLAIEAMALHPLVRSFRVAEAIAADHRSRQSACATL